MIKSSPVIYAVRHGRTPWNAEGRLQGQCDIQLGDAPRAQAPPLLAPQDQIMIIANGQIKWVAA